MAVLRGRGGLPVKHRDAEGAPQDDVKGNREAKGQGKWVDGLFEMAGLLDFSEDGLVVVRFFVGVSTLPDGNAEEHAGMQGELIGVAFFAGN
jgi:hypothetical protein